MTGSHQLEFWAGIECTRNRVGERYFDQCEWTGHAQRVHDLEVFAELGIRTMRYPVLWEWAAPRHPDEFHWEWADARLPLLRALKIKPIAGLVHHGSGPAYTNLLAPDFATGLAAYAGALAERFPWLTDFTPVNEPLTTARFSTLYGVWFPHERSSLAFARAVLHQCRATVLSMRAIRVINPAARLIQTEDMGKAFSTPTLQYQADFENARRWLTFDLLCGVVDSHHPIGNFLLWLGIPEKDLKWFADNPCAPDILGINYYVTSERFLDENLAAYPACYHGGNANHAYADAEAVRARSEGLAGVGAILQEAWDRYHLPLAITEAHLGCRREEQMRWLAEIWRVAQAVKSSGADVRAVTAWSLLGAFDWDSLVTRPEGHYESGVFDIRSGSPRPTALATMVGQFARNEEAHHPVLEQPGWWRRPDRLYGAAPCDQSPGTGRPILISGGNGTLARAFAKACCLRQLAYRILDRSQLDIADSRSVQQAIDKYDPWAVINAAGFVDVDAAELEPERCWRENVLGPTVLASVCDQSKLPLVTFSSDLVFDGQQRVPYREEDTVNPLGVYGHSKATAEGRISTLCQAALIIRTSGFFGPWDQHNFVATTLKNLRQGGRSCALDAIISPTYVPDLVHGTLDLLLDRASGIWHLTSDGQATWGELAQAVAEHGGFPPASIEVCSAATLQMSARRPAFSALTSNRGLKLPFWREALDRYFRESYAL